MVVFDDGVGEEFVAHLADLVGGLGFGVGFERDFHVLAGADAVTLSNPSWRSPPRMVWPWGSLTVGRSWI